jgi:hypothetical protein
MDTMAMGIQGRAVQAIPLAATSHGALQAVSEDLEYLDGWWWESGYLGAA